jgi:putative membrane protein
MKRTPFLLMSMYAFGSSLALIAFAADPPLPPSSAPPAAPLPPPSPSAAISAPDSTLSRLAANSQTFVAAATQTGLLEVEAGKLAMTKGSSSKVRDFAQRVVADHQETTAELKVLAGRIGVRTPTQLDAEHLATLQKLETKSGKEFDAAYSEEMATGHQHTVSLFRQASVATGMEASLQAFAKDVLPTLEEHSRLAAQLRSK